MNLDESCRLSRPDRNSDQGQAAVRALWPPESKKNKNNKKKTVSETVSLWAWKRVPFLKETPRPCKTVEAGQKGCLLSILSFSVMPRPWQLAAVHRGLILALGRQTLSTISLTS